MFQPGLFAAEEQTSFDAAYRHCERIQLDERSWIDHAPGWVSGSDRLFRELVESRPWAQRTRRMHTGMVLEPRLTSPWNPSSKEPLLPIIEAMRRSLGERYAIEFDSVGFNYYRDGNDSVAWHGDKIRKEILQPIVALVSLGEPRKFLLRPRGGGASRAWHLGRGDLFVTGGRTQREWEHAVPKVARAGPRISLAFRHGMDARAYGEIALPGERGT